MRARTRRPGRPSVAWALVAALVAPLAPIAHFTPRGVAFVVPSARAEEPVSGAADDAKLDEARAHFRRGLELADDHDYEGALIEFRKAHALAPTYRIQYNIGHVCLKLHDYVCALGAFESYLAGGKGEIDAERTEEIQKEIEKIRPRVAKLTIVCDVDGATITVDDHVVATTPVSAPVAVSAGRRKVAAVRKGHVPWTQFVDVAGGETVTLRVELPSIEPIVTHDRYLPAAPRSRFTTLSWIGLGASAALAVSGGIFGYLALRSSDDLSEQRYVGETPSPLAKSKQSTTTRLALASDLLFGAALLTAGITLTLTLTRPSPDEANHARAALRVGPSGVFLEGAF